MRLPDKYAWLANTPGPKVILEALKLYDTQEEPGSRDNPTILAWAAEVGADVEYVRRFYKHDSQAWCGLFVAVCVKRAGKPMPTKQPLWALNWSTWGVDSGQPDLGNILTFLRPLPNRRDFAGHVGFYVAEDASHYHVFGGNQSNGVNIKRIEKKRMRACRELYLTGRPASARPIILSADGVPISTDEA